MRSTRGRVQWRRWWLFLTGAALLAGCGGGGSGPSDGATKGVDILTVTVNYSGDAYLFESSTIQPQLTGFNGHSPHCTLASGRLPVGMTLNADCSVSGTPEELGSFAFVVRIGASGVSNTVDYSTGFAVFGPSVLYAFPSSWSLGETVDVSPMNVFWTPGPGTTVRYTIESGALPGGLVLDASTGRVTGTVRTVGAQSFRIGVTVTLNGKTASVTQDADIVTSSSLSGTLYPDDILALLGSTIDIVPAPSAPPGSSLQYGIDSVSPSGTPLPAGLALDPSTGRLSGIPLKAQGRQRFAVTIRVAYGGSLSTQAVPLWLEARSPVVVFYGQYVRAINSPIYIAAPSISGNGVPAPAGATYTYQQNAGSPLPAGLMVNAATGEIAGTTSVAFNGRSLIDVHVMQSNGVAFDITVPVDLDVR